MKDFIGNEISVGDLVVGCVAHGRNSGASLTKGYVSRLTEKTVFFIARGYCDWMNEEERKISPDKVIVISKKEQA